MRYTSAQYAEALLDAAEKQHSAGRAKILKNFLAILSRNRDLKRLPAILRNLESRYLARHRIKKVEIASPEEISATLRRDIEKILGAKTIFVERVRPELLAGITLTVNDELRIDASASRRLGQIFNTAA